MTVKPNHTELHHIIFLVTSLSVNCLLVFTEWLLPPGPGGFCFARVSHAGCGAARVYGTDNSLW